MAGTAVEVVAGTAVVVVAGTAVFFLIIMVLDFSENSSPKLYHHLMPRQMSGAPVGSV